MMSDTTDNLIGAAVGLAVLGLTVKVAKKAMGKDIFNLKIKRREKK